MLMQAMDSRGRDLSKWIGGVFILQQALNAERCSKLTTSTYQDTCTEYSVESFAVRHCHNRG